MAQIGRGFICGAISRAIALNLLRDWGAGLGQVVTTQMGVVAELAARPLLHRATRRLVNLPAVYARDRRHRERKHECEATRQLSPIRVSPGASGFLSQSFGERLTAIAMVMMVIGYLVWPLVQ